MVFFLCSSKFFFFNYFVMDVGDVEISVKGGREEGKGRRKE